MCYICVPLHSAVSLNTLLRELIHCLPPSLQPLQKKRPPPSCTEHLVQTLITLILTTTFPTESQKDMHCEMNFRHQNHCAHMGLHFGSWAGNVMDVRAFGENRPDNAPIIAIFVRIFVI